MRKNSGIDGPGRKDTTNMRIAALQRSERMRCPNCQRKGAMVRVDEINFYPFYRCRWCKTQRYKGEIKIPPESF